MKKQKDKIIGYINGFPVIQRDDVPSGILYASNMDDIKVKVKERRKPNEK